jgi:hypothetical protein
MYLNVMFNLEMVNPLNCLFCVSCRFVCQAGTYAAAVKRQCTTCATLVHTPSAKCASSRVNSSVSGGQRASATHVMGLYF